MKGLFGSEGKIAKGLKRYKDLIPETLQEKTVVLEKYLHTFQVSLDQKVN